MDDIVIQAHRLLDLLAENRDPIYGYDPLCGSHVTGAEYSFGLLDLDARHERYDANLRRLKRRYPDCQIEDNIDLELAKLAATLTTRIARLREVVLHFAGRDAVPEAMLRLGMAYRDHDQADEADEAFAGLMKRYPRSIWAVQAAQLAPRSPWTRLSGAGTGAVP
jgi:hypothetical protein